jgi:hypothetical protein
MLRGLSHCRDGADALDRPVAGTADERARAPKTELRLGLLDEIVRTDNTLPRRMAHA